MYALIVRLARNAQHLAFVLAVAAVGPAAAQAPAATPHAGQRAGPIKALSAEQIADLRAGRGMGLALAAELNGWPGPLHALELADRLDLTAPQRERIAGLRAAMLAEAIPLGERVIEAESALDRLFAERTATPAAIEAGTAAAGAAHAALRAVHLRTHLHTAAVLTPEQSARYAALRGHDAAAPPAGGQGAHPRNH